MKRKIIFIVTTIFIIIIFFTSISFASFIPETIELYSGLYDGKVIAYSEMRAFRLTLANGAVITYSTVTGDTYQIVTDAGRNVQVAIVLDLSSSMTGDVLEEAQAAAKSLVQDLMGLGEDTEFALVSFAKDTETNVGLTGSGDSVIEAIDNTAVMDNYTIMAPAISTADGILSEGKDENAYQYCVIFSDFYLADPEATNSSISAMESKGVGVCRVTVSSSGVNWGDVNKAKETIEGEVVDNVIEDFNFIQEPPYCMILDDKIVITLDNELMQGAVIEIEYEINIKSSYAMSSVEIEDLTNGNVVYNPNAKLITEDKTNSDYGWTLTGDSGLYTNQDKDIVFSNDSSIPKKGCLSKKIVYSRMLSPAEDANFEHATTFKLAGDSENGAATVSSYSLIITPPYGENNINTNLIIFIAIILTVVICSFAIKIKHNLLHRKI